VKYLYGNAIVRLPLQSAVVLNPDPGNLLTRSGGGSCLWRTLRVR
jgi:hypothetical protein